MPKYEIKYMIKGTMEVEAEDVTDARMMLDRYHTQAGTPLEEPVITAKVKRIKEDL